MELHGAPWRLHDTPWNSMKTPWNSMELHGDSMEFHVLSMEFHGVISHGEFPLGVRFKISDKYPHHFNMEVTPGVMINHVK